MRILVVGAGRIGARVLRQLKKNEALTVITLDPRPEPYALQRGLIEQVDIREGFTPLTLEYVYEQAQPDLVLITMTTEDMGLGRAPGLDILAGALKEELAQLSDVPVIEVARTGS